MILRDDMPKMRRDVMLVIASLTQKFSHVHVQIVCITSCESIQQKKNNIPMGYPPNTYKIIKRRRQQQKKKYNHFEPLQ